ncbi:DAR GTPase 2, mitochondrial isoform X1 [Elaeis guineensis]|uniref:DAR GTPase 2, mitochondrial isoform X1 n=1 Tax=Elaeis guineensis var. tenera TaxID=51953 RepID=A0A6I9RWE0_ELAGV|nr:DAR GTPase 2, mitochondrial isoform X1 [Elaeis guineensis]XP_029123137.1 DAR GTPase 2, mitochondrial isoform X1 [Elaeis guineensis]
MATAISLSRRLGAAVREVGLKKGAGGWYGPHMAAAERAILERVPLVDLVVEVRDARIPFTSAFESLRRRVCSHKHMIVLNKVDLANHSLTEKWLKHFENRSCLCYGVNAHNKDNIKELLSIVRAKIKELKVGESTYTATVLLAGIPNVGKSAITNSMHQIGRISAADKGKLKHAVVSPQPGETKDISSYKIASHPNIYILDTPGVLSPKISDDDSASKLALTGTIKDSLVEECKLARYFLAVLNSSEEYKHWENLKDAVDDTLSLNSREKLMADCHTNQKRRRQYSSDHTQDFIVKDVRVTLFKTMSSFSNYMEKENEMERLIESQFMALQEVFRVSLESSEDRYKAVAAKLLNLFRTGRLGRYTLDLVPSNMQELI